MICFPPVSNSTLGMLPAGIEHRRRDHPWIGIEPPSPSQVVLIAASDSPPKNSCAHIMAGNRYREVVKPLDGLKFGFPQRRGRSNGRLWPQSL